MKTFLIVILAIIFASDAMATDVAKAFRDNEIEPDTVAVSPSKLIEVNYPSGVTANLGNVLTPTQVKDEPTLKWDADSNAFYTLLMVDPDAPSRVNATLREVRHWAVVNIPGNAVDKGEKIAEYRSSGPPKDTGLHRYIFLVYKQPNGPIQTNEPYSTTRQRKDRIKTSAAVFSQKYNLGNPEFGNFFQAQFDDYVPILYSNAEN